MKKKFIQISLIFIVFLILKCDLFAERKEIIIFYRDDIPLHRFLIEKIVKFAKEKNNLYVQTFSVSLGADEVNNIIKNRAKNSYFVAIGDAALEMALESGIETFGFYILISKQNLIERAEKTKKWVGTSLNVPFERQFEITLTYLPKTSCIGSIYTERLKETLQEFLGAAKKHNLDVKPIEITSYKDVAPAINSLFLKCDIFWILPDPELVNDITLKAMTLLQYQLKKPVVGIGNKSVAMGALISVNYDINQIPECIVDSIGKFCIKGEEPPYHCRKNAIKIYYNSKTAKMLDINIEPLEQYVYEDVAHLVKN